MQTFRYIITRACLQEGSLRLQRFLRPHFPAEGETVKLFDEGGHDYAVTVTGERLLGVGPFYRDHNLGVNDVVMITPLLPGCYKVEGVVKPYARPEPERSRSEQRPDSRGESQRAKPLTAAFSSTAPNSPSEAAEPTSENGLRVVVGITPHVREVRTQQPEARLISPWSSMERETAQRAVRAERYAVPPLRDVATATEERRQAKKPQVLSEHRVATKADAKVTVRPVRPSAGITEDSDSLNKSSTNRPAQESNGTILTPRIETDLAQARGQKPAVPLRPVREGAVKVDRVDVEPVQHAQSVTTRNLDANPEARPTVAPTTRKATASDAPAIPLASGQDVRDSHVSHGSAAAASQRLLRDLASGPEGVRRASRRGGDSGLQNESLASSSAVVHPALAAGGAPIDSSPTRLEGEKWLEMLGRRCGYRVDYPAPDVMQLRAELGPYSHTVLVATGGRAVASAEWREGQGSQGLQSTAAPLYRLWLTPEAQAPAHAPVVTPEALQQLASLVQEAPFTPLDLRPFWEAGRLNTYAAAALAAQRATEREQDAAFHSVLRALAQQSAPSLVHASQLAEQLSTINPNRLNQLLTLLTRAPYRLLARLEGDNYLLEQDVPGYLLRLGQEFQGLSGQVRGVSPASPKTVHSAVSEANERSWTAEEILRG